VASGILPDVEGGILPPGSKRPTHPRLPKQSFGLNLRMALSAGLEARLHGRQGCLPLRRKSGLSSVSIRVYPWLIFSGSFTTD
jgi:hypothetical protein